MVNIQDNPLYFAAIGGIIIGISTSLNYAFRGSVTGMSGMLYSTVTLDKSTYKSYPRRNAQKHRNNRWYASHWRYFLRHLRLRNHKPFHTLRSVRANYHLHFTAGIRIGGHSGRVRDKVIKRLHQRTWIVRAGQVEYSIVCRGCYFPSGWIGDSDYHLPRWRSRSIHSSPLLFDHSL